MTTTMTPFEERVLTLLKEMAEAQKKMAEAREKRASAGWWVLRWLLLLWLAVSVATLIFSARHQIHAWWSPAAAERAAEERALAEERVRREARKELDEEEAEEEAARRRRARPRRNANA